MSSSQASADSLFSLLALPPPAATYTIGSGASVPVPRRIPGRFLRPLWHRLLVVVAPSYHSWATLFRRHGAARYNRVPNRHPLLSALFTLQPSLVMRVRLTWPRSPFLWSSHLTALPRCAKFDVLPLFERRDVALRK